MSAPAGSFGDPFASLVAADRRRQAKRRNGKQALADADPELEPDYREEADAEWEAEHDADHEREPQAKAGITRTARAFRKGSQAVYGGADFEGMCAALHGDRLTAPWMREEGEANDRLEARRIFDKAQSKGTTIQIKPGELHHETTAAAAALLQSGIPIFQRGSRLVRPAVVDVSASKGRTTKSASLHKMDQAGLLDKMSACINAVKFDSKKKEFKLADIPSQWASFMLSRFGEWKHPSVAGIITTPTLRPDGTVLTQGGYDASTRLYHDADPSLVLHPAVANPTRANADAALKLLKNLLDEFPFVDETSRAVALSGLITPVVRGGMSVAPLHAYKASTPATGKSYLVDVASAIASGRPCPAGGADMESPQETEKRITGMLLAGYPLCSLDNCNGELASDLLCRAVERPIVNLRPLGTSNMEDVECRNTFFVTGNNLRVAGDLVRRTIVATLDARMERPEQRTFKAKPVDTVLADRGRYVSACLVVVRGYIVANRPHVANLKSLASYEDWSGTVRAALMWLGEADPVLSMEAARDEDPRIMDRREVVNAWHSAFEAEQASLPVSAHGLTLASVAEKLEQQIRENEKGPLFLKYPKLREVLMRFFGAKGHLDTTALGNWLSDNQGVIVDGLRFQRAEAKAAGGRTKWLVAKVD